jgi:hypothetical protein
MSARCSLRPARRYILLRLIEPFPLPRMLADIDPRRTPTPTPPAARRAPTPPRRRAPTRLKHGHMEPDRVSLQMGLSVLGPSPL